ncbi:hypothetical protein NEUTE1DRAFT_44593, partial [Neurospora tetrasperma FGSC 2508]
IANFITNKRSTLFFNNKIFRPYTIIINISQGSVLLLIFFILFITLLYRKLVIILNIIIINLADNINIIIIIYITEENYWTL